MTKNYLLSICIPTYNRGEILKKTLASITNDPAFDRRVEIIVSDNCSTDNTEEVCKKFTSLFENIRYYKTDSQINEGNFVAVLSHADGLYLKLHNDYAKFKTGKLEKIIFEIKASLEQTSSLLFIQNNHDYTNTVILTKNINQFIQSTTYAICWITNVGFWKSDFIKIKESSFNYLEYNYIHVDMCLNTLVGGRLANVHYDDFYDISQAPKNKAIYNVFDVNVSNLLLVFMGFNGSRCLNFQSQIILKRSVFRNVAFGHFLNMIKLNIKMHTDTDYYKGWWNVLWLNYKSLLFVFFIYDCFAYTIRKVFKLVTTLMKHSNH